MSFFFFFSCGIVFWIWFWLKLVFFLNVTHRLVGALSFPWPSSSVIESWGNELVQAGATPPQTPPLGGDFSWLWLAGCGQAPRDSLQVTSPGHRTSLFSKTPKHRCRGDSSLTCAKSKACVVLDMPQMCVFSSGSSLPACCDEGLRDSVCIAHTAPSLPSRQGTLTRQWGLCTAWKLKGQELPLNFFSGSGPVLTLLSCWSS